jgi:hypothetical protein
MVPLGVDHPVLHVIAETLLEEVAVGLEAEAVGAEGLVVRVDDLTEGVADGELHRTALAVGPGAAKEVSRQPRVRTSNASSEST